MMIVSVTFALKNSPLARSSNSNALLFGLASSESGIASAATVSRPYCGDHRHGKRRV
jgi:hypothetical protein